MYELKKAIENLLEAKDKADELGDCEHCYLVDPTKDLRTTYEAVKDRL